MSTGQPVKKAPLPPAPRLDKPVAPPSLSIKHEEQQKKTRSRSMIVKNTKSQVNSIGQTPSGPFVPFDPKKAFDAAAKDAVGFPRSELQLPDTSTLLHPSQICQIILGVRGSDDVSIQIKTRRSHTIAGDAKTIKLPSGYRETLLKRRQEPLPSHPSGPSLSSLITQPNLPGPTPSVPKVSKGHAKKTPEIADSVTANEDATLEAALATPVLRNEEAESDAAEAIDDDANAKSEASSASSSPAGEPEAEEDQPFALQYNEGLIDFVDHPEVVVEGSPEGEGHGTEGGESEEEEDGEGGKGEE